MGSPSAVLYNVLHTTNGVPVTAVPKRPKHLVLKVGKCTIFSEDLIQVEISVYVTSVYQVDITVDISTLIVIGSTSLTELHILYLLWRFVLVYMLLGY